MKLIIATLPLLAILTACQPQSPTRASDLTATASALATTNVTEPKLDRIYGQERGGGDARVIRSRILNEKRASLERAVRNSFQAPILQLGVTNYLSSLANGLQGRVKLSDTKARAILMDMIEKGFAQDLSKAQFNISDSCKDTNGVEKSAVALMDAPRSPICINPARIVDEFGPYIQDSDLIALAMHEFSHHYGHLDADHSFAAAIGMDWQTSTEQSNPDAKTINSLMSNF